MIIDYDSTVLTVAAKRREESQELTLRQPHDSSGDCSWMTSKSERIQLKSGCAGRICTCV